MPIAKRGSGGRSFSPSAPTLPTTTLPIASITKQFTAACILILQEDGLLSIDDPLTTYVPEVTYGRSITLRDLLVQISGLTKLLGLIVERVSKTNYNSFLKRRMFSEAGMPSSYLATNGSDPALALGYRLATGGRFRRAASFSTVADELSWDHALTTGRLLNATSLQTMFAVPSLPNGVVTHYAMGSIIGTNVAWHNGDVSGFHAMNAIFPDGYAVVALGNQYQEDNTTDQWHPGKLALAIHRVFNPASSVSLEPLTPVPPILE